MQFKWQPHISFNPFLLERTQRFFHSWSQHIWNALPVKIKSSPSLASFTADIAKHSKSIDGILLGLQSQTKVVGRVVHFNSSPF